VNVWVFSLTLNPEAKYITNDKTRTPELILKSDNFLTGESCGNFSFPKIYIARLAKTIIQIPKKASILSKPQCLTKSALERNLNAKASSKKP
jgi:hypothetical protein